MGENGRLLYNPYSLYSKSIQWKTLLMWRSLDFDEAVTLDVKNSEKKFGKNPKLWDGFGTDKIDSMIFT